MTARTGVMVMLGFVAAMLAASLVLVGLIQSVYPPILTGSMWQDAMLVLAIGLYPVIGALIVSHRSRNRVGWVFLASGLLLLAWLFSAGYASYGLLIRPDSLPAAEFLGWVSTWIVLPGFGVAVVFLPLLFPSGRLESRWQRITAWFGGFAIAFTTLAWLADPEPGTLTPDGGYLPVELVASYRLNEWSWGLLVIAVASAAASMVARYRRSTGVVRLQLGWFAFGAVLVCAVWIVVTLGSDWVPARAAAEAMFPIAVASLPIAAAVAIFRHDLYDLELVVSQTLTYGIVLVVIGGLYITLVAAIGTLVGVAGGSSVAVAAVAAAVVAIAFAPLRTWAEKVARQVTYGERADPYQVLAAFARRVGAAPDPTGALAETANLVKASTGARQAGVWLVVGRQLRLIASSPPAHERPSIPVTDGLLPLLPRMTHAVRVASQTRLLGAISWRLGPGQSSNRTEQRLIADLAAQAALVFENLRLIEEVKESRQRIVTAQDRERRRLERDLHDGVQQRLLALALQLSSSAARGDIGGLSGAADEARHILVELRRLARGIHPAVVVEGGLLAAIDSLAERSPIPVSIEAPAIGRLPPEVEVTLYYVAAESLTNATRHADAAGVEILLGIDGSAVRMTVTDDGAGGADPSGGGLTGLADRVAAVGGDMVVASPLGGGTRIVVEIPCG